MPDHRTVLVLLAFHAIATPIRSQAVAAQDSTLAIQINVPAFLVDVLADNRGDPGHSPSPLACVDTRLRPATS